VTTISGKVGAKIQLLQFLTPQKLAALLAGTVEAEHANMDT